MEVVLELKKGSSGDWRKISRGGKYEFDRCIEVSSVYHLNHVYPLPFFREKKKQRYAPSSSFSQYRYRVHIS